VRYWDWRGLCNKELYDPYSSPNVIWEIKSRRMRLVDHVVHMGDRSGAYGVLVGRPQVKRPLGRPRHRWEDNNMRDSPKISLEPIYIYIFCHLNKRSSMYYLCLPLYFST
jgi:hypothetical protein